MTTAIRSALTGFLESAANVLASHPNTYAPGRVVMAPGSLASWDDCCDGQLWLRVSNLVPSGNPFPQSLGAASPCLPPMTAITAHLGIVRCIATIDDRGRAPSALEVTNDGITALDDALVLYEWLTRLDPLEVGFAKVIVDSWQPLGPNGGCAGGEWSVTLGV